MLGHLHRNHRDTQHHARQRESQERLSWQKSPFSSTLSSIYFYEKRFEKCPELCGKIPGLGCGYPINCIEVGSLGKLRRRALLGLQLVATPCYSARWLVCFVSTALWSYRVWQRRYTDLEARTNSDSSSVTEHMDLCSAVLFAGVDKTFTCTLLLFRQHSIDTSLYKFSVYRTVSVVTCIYHSVLRNSITLNGEIHAFTDRYIKLSECTRTKLEKSRLVVSTGCARVTHTQPDTHSHPHTKTYTHTPT